MKLSKVRIKNYKSFADSGEVSLGAINIVIGRNNSGKSAFINAIHLLQMGAKYKLKDIRYRESYARISYELEDLKFGLGSSFETGPPFRATVQIASFMASSDLDSIDLDAIDTDAIDWGESYFHMTLGTDESDSPMLLDTEPDNFIYPYFSKRKMTTFDHVVNFEKTISVSNDLRNLVSKVNRLINPDHPKHREYSTLCKGILGFRVSTIPSSDGHQAGVILHRYGNIAIEDMGEGVSSVLGLITDLCVADGNLFLIEEPENDIHPQALKKLLQLIAEKASKNQFIVTTHSNIVMKYLGSEPDSKIFNVKVTNRPETVPTSSIREIKTSKERMEVLQELGYEFHDFDLWEGWIFLEESSAEVIIRDYLIPWFAPKLSRVRTVAAGGTGNIEPYFEDFNRLALFVHLQPQYEDRSWVIADGDGSGKEVVRRLHEAYRSWSADHFLNWSETDFEHYYPAQFNNAVAEALSENGKQQKRSAKASLIRNVRKFCDEKPEEAKSSFRESAKEVISVLLKIEADIFGQHSNGT